ncbi:tRNA lysidine(34) synthetase TilS [Leisingera sp. HS039]|uniref:tRNA lysidine(34) synthetase TilS n=1 Tax=unclassified Leisingera TaxID=2614906 RepID=UPI001070D6B3|nr:MULTISPECIES: tRNA lysidine(34) synthetase TilS [unclassified Leisingera]MBQ4825373.1 tRNA lysidine(34) synthetase TilS [Leisingera sp. HS039]QBR35509.1 tRNA lysidine(34) synthetase TilS [Leisingera sp. NJS201]
MTGVRRDILPLVQSQFRSALPDRLGIAVSGGGDSMALLHLLHDCFAGGEVTLFAATVDHGLRPEAAAEAEVAGAAAARLGISHAVLRWEDGPQEGNLQNQAREARYDLLTGWARRHGIPVLALGHTADDQAETVLMRMARASGVTGLSGMAERRTHNGVTLLRPLLDVTRCELRDYLEGRGIAWSEDPSNEDTRFERVRVRRALQELAPLGLTPAVFAKIARNMAKAREALDWYVFLAARDLAHVQAGAVVLCQRKFRTLPSEISHRLLVRSIQWISGTAYPPRRVPMEKAVLAARNGGSATLAGCRLVTTSKQIWICREYNSVRGEASLPGQAWDGRWKVFGGDAKGCEIRALGQKGLQLCPDWRAAGMPGAVLQATPAVWRGGELAAAPAAGFANGWSAETAGTEEEFFASLLSH